ncbi:MAG: hypothetical protein M3M87_02080, partial [Thermoproteota archaeon]|nr:hypothetical protein [Thermoproteota archaeon]
SLPGGESSADYMASRAEEEVQRTEVEGEKDTETIGVKMKAGAKALKKKVQDPDRSINSEYQKEKG